ncbi:hypothetical protein C0992_002290 [Termitomyces sp. T32_za158]|nr:hypothetical protein C0992_002290 [Termitomyces sp. T32_za158]
MLLACLWEVYQLKGFSGNPTPGMSRHSSQPQVAPTTYTQDVPPTLDALPDSDSEDEMDDAALNDVGAVVDFLSNMD